MHFMMNPDMVYQYPIWAVGLLLITITVAGAVFLELCVRRILPAGLRRQHNEVTAALFLIIGVTYAVLLAFVAMLAWENFNRAKAASYAEAAAILDVYNAAIGFTDPKTSLMRSDIIGYAREVVNVEWPAQAQGRTVDEVSAYLERLNNAAVALDPSSLAAGNLHAMLLQALMRLQDARQDRLLAAQTTIPDIVWFVLLFGGALTVAFSSLRTQLMDATFHVRRALAVGCNGAYPDHRSQQPVPR